MVRNQLKSDEPNLFDDKLISVRDKRNQKAGGRFFPLALAATGSLRHSRVLFALAGFAPSWRK